VSSSLARIDSISTVVTGSPSSALVDAVSRLVKLPKHADALRVKSNAR